MQDCSVSIANALEILQSCTKPSNYSASPSHCEEVFLGPYHGCWYLDTCVISSTTMTSTEKAKWVFVFHSKRFCVHVSSQCWEIRENTNTHICFQTKFRPKRVKNTKFTMKRAFMPPKMTGPKTPGNEPPGFYFRSGRLAEVAHKCKGSVLKCQWDTYVYHTISYVMRNCYISLERD